VPLVTDPGGSGEQTVVRVLVADDHGAQRMGVRRVLEADGLTVCAEAADAPGAVEAAIREKPDICLLDVHMPGSGIEAARAISRELSSTVVVMLTVSENDEDLFAALRAGAAGYLLKDMDPGRLTAALLGVLNGEAAIPRELMSRVMEELRGKGTRRLPLPGEQRSVELTAREWEILHLLAADRSTKEISEQLHVSPVTVRRHVSELLKRLRVRTRDEAIHLLRTSQQR
jgi:DNA-binding NarL/FixJ family response regulator